jgi:hypothetical protein
MKVTRETNTLAYSAIAAVKRFTLPAADHLKPNRFRKFPDLSHFDNYRGVCHSGVSTIKTFYRRNSNKLECLRM